MAQQLADRVKETTTTTGTGAVTLAGAMTGFRAFSAICAVGDTCYYALQGVDSSGNPTGDWEVGLGTYSAASTLTRTAVYASSNAGAAVNLTGGTYQVWMDFPASKLPLQGMGDFLDTLSTASPNATVPVVGLAPNNSATNADMSIVPKGTGALQLAIPDGTTTGGNKRGTNAVDLCMTRTANSHVASGASSFQAGSDCTASSTSAVAMGAANVASGSSSIAMGASCTASASNAVAIGLSCTASGTSAVSIGASSQASGANSTTLGTRATTNSISGQVAMGFNGSAATGKFQRTFTQLRPVTTSTAATVATADGASASASNQLTLRNKSAFRVRMTAVAFDATNFTDAKEWTADLLVVRGAAAANTSIVGSPAVTTTYATAGASGWTLAISADTTNGALQVTVTSSTTDTVDWNIQLDAIEVM